MPREDKIPVVEIFGPTFQGEGVLIGQQTLFVRTAACDYLCKVCDSMYAVEAKPGKGATIMTSDEIVEALVKLWPNTIPSPGLVTLSGGNPALWDFSTVVRKLQEIGFSVAIETQGSVWQPWIASCDYITVSPKGPGMIEDQVGVFKDVDHFINKCHSFSCIGAVTLKIPVLSKDDILFARIIHEKYPYIPLVLSVGNHWVNSEMEEYAHKALLLRNLRMVAETVLEYEDLHNVFVLPQMHVLIWGNQKGV